MSRKKQITVSGKRYKLFAGYESKSAATKKAAYIRSVGRSSAVIRKLSEYEWGVYTRVKKGKR
jgi:hypothetical protein